MSLKTEGVDISPEAVERAASGAELNGQRWLAEMLRELSRSLTASEKDAEELRWLKAHPDELCSAVQDAYGQWSGEDPADFSDILADEITHQRAKV